MRPVKIGLHIDISEYPEDYILGTPTRQRRPDRWNDIAAMARRAEQLGFDSVTIPDHLLYRLEPGLPPEGVWECWSILSGIAAITSRVEIGTGVLSTQFRNPALVAKLADTVDEISSGRLVLGLGAGWHAAELAAFGYPTDHPAGRFEEALKIIHGLLRHGHLDFAGRYYRVSECELRPRGPRPTGPPIMIGASGERMLRLTARYADLWNDLVDARTQDRFASYAAIRARVDQACEAEGRDPATLGRTMIELVNPLDRPEYTATDRGPAISGSPDAIAEMLWRYGEAGVSHLMLVVLPVSVASVEAMAPVLAALDRR